jgi:hypothetical protein
MPRPGGMGQWERRRQSSGMRLPPLYLHLAGNPILTDDMARADYFDTAGQVPTYPVIRGTQSGG